MKKLAVLLFVVLFASAAYAQDLAATLNKVLMDAPKENHWQVKPADVAKWIAEGKKDFLVVDVRPNPPGQKGGRIPGSIYIPYSEILKAENLKKLPKDKVLVLACVTGQTQNLPVLALRALGYNARTMSFGMSGWIKGYFGANFMREAIAAAEAAKYPLEQ